MIRTKYNQAAVNKRALLFLSAGLLMGLTLISCSKNSGGASSGGGNGGGLSSGVVLSPGHPTDFGSVGNTGGAYTLFPSGLSSGRTYNLSKVSVGANYTPGQTGSTSLYKVTSQ